MKVFVKNILFCLGIILLSHSTLLAQTAPHNFTNAVDCEDCHLLNLWGGGAGTPPATDPFFLKDCGICHNNQTGANYTRNSAPFVRTHSDAVIGSGTFGNWTRDCWDCHGHKIDATPVVTGNYTAYSASAGLTTFTIDSNFTVNDSNWSDPSSWSAKSNFEDQERGLIFSVKFFDATENETLTKDYEIEFATSTSVTVKEEEQTLAQTGSFELFYGQMIRKLVDGQHQVELAGNTTFAENDGLNNGDDSTPDGVCQVCHTLTRYWRSDGTLADHNDGKNCTFCHKHADGFRPACNACHGEPPVVSTLGGPDGLVDFPTPTGSVTHGEHPLHAAPSGYNYDCFNCHLGGMLNVCVCDDEIDLGFTALGFGGVGTNYDGQTNVAYGGNEGMTVSNNGTLTCTNVYCHSDGTAVATAAVTANTSPAWDGSTVDGDGNRCNNCHAYPPSYAQNNPKANSHHIHGVTFDYTCEACHYGTTTDATSIADKQIHVNASYDVVPSPEFDTFDVQGTKLPLTFDYQFSSGGGTCSNNSCHQYWGVPDPKNWGGANMEPNVNWSSTGNCAEILFDAVAPFCNPSCTEPFTYEWDFGDGTTGSGNPVTHAYPDVGDYTVTLTQIDANSVTGTWTNTVTAVAGQNIPPIAGHSIQVSGTVVTLTDLTVDPDYNSCGHSGDGFIQIFWGDGQRHQGPLTLTDTPSNQVFTHDYGRSGTFTLSRFIYDNAGTRITPPNIIVTIP